jgi:hypothetical protein
MEQRCERPDQSTLHYMNFLLFVQLSITTELPLRFQQARRWRTDGIFREPARRSGTGIG